MGVIWRQTKRRDRRVLVRDVTADDAAAITLGLLRPEVKALAILVGTLDPLPSKEARRRVLQYVIDKCVEDQQIAELAQ